MSKQGEKNELSKTIIPLEQDLLKISNFQQKTKNN